MTLHPHDHEGTDSALTQEPRELNNDAIFTGVPVEMNLKLRPVVKPTPGSTNEHPKAE
jgi:hypothetical protein